MTFPRAMVPTLVYASSPKLQLPQQRNMADLPPAYTESQIACSTCAQLLDFSSKQPEAPVVPLQQPCCGRWVCSLCIDVSTLHYSRGWEL
jgi:hypothetical protein